MLDNNIFKSFKKSKSSILKSQKFDFPKLNKLQKASFKSQDIFNSKNFLPKNIYTLPKLTMNKQMNNVFKQTISKPNQFQNKSFKGKPWQDNDRDGLINAVDCDPNNYFKQGWHNDIDSKEEEYLDIESSEFKDKSYYSEDAETYGETSSVSGKKAGAIVATSGVVVPVVLPLPLTSAVGGYLAKKVEKIKVIKTDEHDKRYKIPKLEFHKKGASKTKQNEWKNMSHKERDNYREYYPDSDGDRVPDKYDCEPDNTMAQDTWNFPKGMSVYENEPLPEMQIITENDKAISLGEYSENIRDQGEQKFIATTYFNRAEKLEDLYETAEVIHPLNFQGYNNWRNDMSGSDLQGVDTPDNSYLINKYESEMQEEMNKPTRENILRGYEIIRQNPESFKDEDKHEAAKELAIALQHGKDPTFLIQEYGDKGSDITYDEYKENEQSYLNN